ncbi:MAG: penicillin-binding protein 1A [Gammaproteobacteria bacterium]|nr:penicillin-binding protein 1A [Gammaproteobacteria bacterium]
MSAQRKKHPFIRLSTLVAILGTLFLLGFFYSEWILPKIEPLRDMPLQVPLRIFSRDGKLIGEYGQERRSLIQRKSLPDLLIKALIATEDQRFYDHNGVDFWGLLRAAIEIIKTGQKTQGGGTITMQVARNFFLSPERSFTRKFNEILLAWKIEQKLTKDEILVLYFNKIYMGYRAYGISAAAQVYYGKTVAQLTLPEIAMLAGIPKAPSAINPLANPIEAKARRAHVLERMFHHGFIDEEQFQKALQTPLNASYHGIPIEMEAPYVAEMVRNELIKRYNPEELYTKGYRVITTIDGELQRYANQALRAGLLAYDRRHGFRKPEEFFEPLQKGESFPKEMALAFLGKKARVGNLYAALVSEVLEKEVTVLLANGKTLTVPWEGLSWAKRYVHVDAQDPPPQTASEIVSPGDKIYVYLDKNLGLQLASIPTVNGAFVVLSPSDGSLLALVGGFDYFENNYNRVVQAKRQPGSSFKPFIYSAALENGYTAASIINDAPLVFEEDNKIWRPENYTREFSGPIRLREALAKSRNLATIRLLQQVGISRVLPHIKPFGFSTEQLPHDLSLALGSGEVTPLELTRGFAVFANGGYRVDPILIQRVENAKGEVLEEIASIEGTSRGSQKGTRIISEENAYVMRSLLKDVITYGTAYRAKSLGRHDLSGKTGTTNDHADAWFVGFNSNLVACAWVGFDAPAPLGELETGGRVALPIWISFMKNALRGRSEHTPPQPSGIVVAKIDPQTGWLAKGGEQDAIFELFYKGSLPQQKNEEEPKSSKGSWFKIPEQLF